MNRKVLIFLYIAVFSAALVFVYIRFVPTNASALHNDPATAHSTGRPNAYRLKGGHAPVFELPAAKLAKLVDDFSLSQPRVMRIAGSIDEMMITYVQRSLIMGYPDYITIKVIPLDNGQSKLEVFSRSRFGHSDLGVNKRRIDHWILALRAQATLA
jgi:uncharacterized protein (DUF1499 family)